MGLQPRLFYYSGVGYSRRAFDPLRDSLRPQPVVLERLLGRRRRSRTPAAAVGSLVRNAGLDHT
jgi:hypothetical protein